jgi:hypothetical protein
MFLEEHYGKLPKLFTGMVNNLDLNQANVHELSNIYYQSKSMIMNKTCDSVSRTAFAICAPAFLKIWSIENEITQDLIFLKNIIQLEMKNPVVADSKSLNKALAKILLLEGNYRDALRQIEIYQEEITQRFGRHIQGLAFCYHMRCQCYIKIGNRTKAKSALKQYKKFARASGKECYEDDISYFEKEIAKMPKNDETCNRTDEMPISTKSQCSSYA